MRKPQLDMSCDVHVYSKHFAFKQPQTFKQPLTRYFYISSFQSINLSALTSCHSAPSTSAYLAELAIKQQLIFWRKSHLCLLPLPSLNPHVSLLYSLNMAGRIRSGDFLAHFEKQNWFYLTKYGCFICFEALVSATEAAVHHMSSWCPLFLKWTKKAFSHIGVCLMVESDSPSGNWRLGLTHLFQLFISLPKGISSCQVETKGINWPDADSNLDYANGEMRRMKRVR